MANNAIMRYFDAGHLPPNLAPVSEKCGELATWIDQMLTDCPEKSAGLRHLLEAKDCFVRAAL